MQLTDSHAHLYADEFSKDIDEVIRGAKENDVTRIFLPNIDDDSVAGLKNLTKNHPDTCFPMMGLHPGSVEADYEGKLSVIKKELFAGDYVAVGEIGIDLYWEKKFIDQQLDAFEKQIDWSLELDIPIVIHCRDSMTEILDVLERKQNGNLKGVLHCFTGGKTEGEKLLELGFYLGVGGILTFKNSGLDKTIKDFPLNRLLLETDAPYLSPEPNRGKRNESANIIHIARKLAEVKNLSVEEIAEVTTRNSKDLFGC